MNLFELFDQSSSGDDLVKSLRDTMIDSLVGLAAHGVPYVTVQNVIDKLKATDPGIEVDRPLVMHILDPQEVKLVTKIEGDRIYFSLPDQNDRKVDDNQKEKDKAHVASQAQDQAKKAVSKDSPFS
jgi:hypothetical protein